MLISIAFVGDSVPLLMTTYDSSAESPQQTHILVTRVEGGTLRLDWDARSSNSEELAALILDRARRAT